MIEPAADKTQLEFALDRPFTREASLRLDHAVIAAERARRRRANAIAERLVGCLNRRDSIRFELQRPNDPDRCRYLEHRLAQLYDEQDGFEAALTRLAACLDA